VLQPTVLIPGQAGRQPAMRELDVSPPGSLTTGAGAVSPRGAGARAEGFA